jgi:hypothetical protein
MSATKFTETGPLWVIHLCKTLEQGGRTPQDTEMAPCSKKIIQEKLKPKKESPGTA